MFIALTCVCDQGRLLCRLPKSEDLKEEIYEIDADAEQLDESAFSKIDGITKEGFLLKGPDVSSDRMFVNIGSKSFKRRYCYLRQQVDGSYILELYKDDKRGDAKATIDMEFCTEVLKVNQSFLEEETLIFFSSLEFKTRTKLF